jgi:hypothetical protein
LSDIKNRYALRSEPNFTDRQNEWPDLLRKKIKVEVPGALPGTIDSVEQWIFLGFRTPDFER